MGRLDRHNLGPIVQENTFALGSGMDQLRSGCLRSLQVHVWLNLNLTYLLNGFKCETWKQH